MSSQGYYFRDSCRLCNGKALQRVIELTPTPPGNDFVAAAERGVPQDFYPLEVYFCNDCAHVQLGHVVDPEILYRRNYSYVSGTSAVFVDHLRRYAAHMNTEFDLPAGSLVVDIGSNDGTALSFFQEAGFRMVGVDPATEIAQLARDRGIETLCEFFGSEHARKWCDEYGPAQLITSGAWQVSFAPFRSSSTPVIFPPSLRIRATLVFTCNATPRLRATSIMSSVVPTGSAKPPSLS